MADNIVVGVTIRAQGSGQVTSEMNRVRDGVAGAGNAAQTSNRQFAELNSTLNGLKNMLGGIALAAVVKDIVDTNREMESLRARLKALVGSAAEAKYTFDFITKFAKNTPFEIEGLTKSFVTLQNFGIKPTAQVMGAITNQAAKLGSSTETLTGITLALGQAYSKGKLQAEEMNQLTERGVPIMQLLTEVTGKQGDALAEMAKDGDITREVIDKLIIKMGELASGSNAEAMDTLNGKISNLSDAWHTFEDTLMNDKSEGILKDIVDSMSGLLNTLSRNISESIDNQISHAEARIKTFDSMGFISKGLADFAGYDINVEKNRLDALTRKKQKADDAHAEIELNKDRAAAIAQTNQWLDDLESKQVAKKEARHAGGTRAHTAHTSTRISNAQREAEATAKATQQTIASLNDQHAKLVMSERDYFAQSEAIAKMDAPQKAYAMSIWDSNKAIEEKTKADQAQKSEMAALIEKYNQLTLSAREYYALTLKNKGIAPDQQAPYLKQFDKNADVEAQTKSIDAARAAVADYNNAIDTTSDKMSGLAATTSSVFDGALGGVSTLIGALNSMVEVTQKNAKAFESLAKQKKILEESKPDPASKTYLNDLKEYDQARKKSEIEYADLKAQSLNNSLDGVRQIAGATASMYGESKDAALAYNVIALTTLAVQAAIAIASQGKGDPYTAFARIAAMAAIMASIVASVGGKSAAVPPSGSVDTGTVLGDKTAKSESIGNVYQLLKDIHAEEYAELRGINAGVSALQGGVTNVITRLYQAGGITDQVGLLQPTKQLGLPKVNPNGTASRTLSMLTGLPGLGESLALIGNLLQKYDPVQKLLTKLFFGTIKEKVVGGGIATDPLRAGEDVTGSQYTTIERTRKSWISKKVTFREALTELDQGTKEALTSVFTSMGDTMTATAAVLGKQIGIDIGGRVTDYIIPSLRVELRGLSGEEAAKKMNGVLSATLDTMAASVFGDIVGQYQQLGEGMLETAIRIVSEVAVVKDALAQSGLVMTENALALSDALVQAAGGLEEFQAQFEAYYDKFYSDAEKNTRLQDRLISQFGDLNLLLPKTREGYRSLLEGLNLNNAADAERYSLLLKLAGAADTYYTAITDATEATQEAAKAQQEYYDSMGKNANDAVVKAREDLKAAYKAQTGEISGVIAKMTDFIAKMKAFKESLTLSNLSTGTPLDKYNESRKQLYASYDTIKGGAGTTKESQAAYEAALSSIQDKAKTFLDASRTYNASGSQYTDDFNMVLSGIDSVSGLVGEQQTDAQKQLDAMNAANDILNTINGSVLSVKDATDNLYNAINAQAKMSKAIGDSKAAENDLASKQANYDNAATAQKSAQVAYDNAVAKYNNETAAIAKWKLDANRAVAENKAYFQRASDVGDQATMDRLTEQLPILLANAQASGRAFSSNAAVIQAKAELDMLNGEKANASAALATSKNYYDATINLINYLESVRSSGDLKSEITQYGIAALGRQLTAFEIDWINQQVANKANIYDTYATIDTYALTNGSHKNGLDFVPFDGYRAELHKGERVLTASQARNDGAISQEVVAELKALRAEVAQLRAEQHDQTGAVIQSNYDANDRAADKVVTGTKDASKDVVWATKSKAVIV
jgi:tape measure domain-containing protein